jgi:putative peptidoglycan lipid II flippase
MGKSSFWKHSQQMGWAALVMGLSTLISRFMGLFRDQVISYLFGATRESDIYFAAFVIPDFINYLLAGAYFSITLIPLLATRFDKDPDDGWQFFSAVVFWVAAAISLLTLLGIMCAPRLAFLAAPGLTGDGLNRLAGFLRIILPAQVFFLVGSCFMAVLYVRKQFLAPALAPIVYNLSIILGGVLMRARGMEGFCWGVLVGSILGHLALPLIAVRFGGGLRLTARFTHPGLKRFIILALPLMLGQSIVVLDEQFLRVFGSMVGEGAVSWLNYGRRIMMVPVGVVAQAAGVASYPFLAELVARKDKLQFDQTLHLALKNILVVLLPLSVWLMVVSEPAIRLLFQQGHFSASDTEATSSVLRIFLTVVVCWGFSQVMGRAFYAHEDTLTPVLLGTGVTVLAIGVFYALARTWQVNGVAVASSLSITNYSLALGLVWRRRFGGEAFRGLGKSAFLISVFSVLAAGAGYPLTRLSLSLLAAHPVLEALWEIALSGVGFGAVFLVLVRLFAPQFLDPFLNRMGRFGKLFSS